MRIYCVWTRIVASTPSPPRLRYAQTRSTLSLPLLSRCFASLKNDRLFSLSPFSRGDVVALPSKCRNYYRFSSSSFSSPPASSLIFLARVGRTLLRRVSRKSDDTSNTRSRRSWRELTRLPIPSLSLFFGFRSSEKNSLFLGEEGGRARDGEERIARSTRFKSENSGYTIVRP